MLIPKVSNKKHQYKIYAWLQKLSEPQMNHPKFQELRNKYLMMLTLSLLNKTVMAIFNAPPENELLETENLQIIEAKSKWEQDLFWTEIVEQHNEISQSENKNCSIHTKDDCPQMNEVDSMFGAVLDKQFKLYLYMAKPHIVLLKNRQEKLLASQWIQALCCIKKFSCTAAKSIRNDYMIALGGYLTIGLAGPFLKFPPVPLTSIDKIPKNKVPITDPTHYRADEFLKTLPKPEEGAFAFIALTGDLYDSFQ